MNFLDKMINGFKEEKTRLKLFALFMRDEKNNEFCTLEASYTLEDAFAQTRLKLAKDIQGLQASNLKLMLWEIQDAELLIEGFLKPKKMTFEPRANSFGELQDVMDLAKTVLEEKFGPENVKIESIILPKTVTSPTPPVPLPPTAPPDAAAEKNDLMREILQKKDAALLEKNKGRLLKAEFEYLQEKIKS